MIIGLNDLRHLMAEYMREHPRGSLDSAFFHVMKIAYRRGFEDGVTAAHATVSVDQPEGPPTTLADVQNTG